jgi:hypothetical protein
MTRHVRDKSAVTIGEARMCFGGEPTVREMLDDPVVQAVMAVDRVTPAEIMSVMAAARQRLTAGALPG